MKKSKIKITQLFGIKILDNIENYLYSQKKNSKNHGFYKIGKYRGQRYITDKINHSLAKKNLKLLKGFKKVTLILNTNKKSQITKINAHISLKTRNPNIRKLYLKYKKNLDIDICNHFNLEFKEFENNYYIDSLGENELSSSKFKFSLNGKKILISTELETFPKVYGGLSHLDFSLSTEEIWKGQYLKDCEFSLQDNE
tara:strand:- start:193 stop:786 length:594 start_codon:yes stop_codon:yes gene_type:complete